MTLNTQDVAHEAHEKLDEKFLAELGKRIDAYYVKIHNPKFPKATLPQNQEMTLLLDIIRQANNINARNKNEHTLLSLVAYTNERELLELLLSHPQIDVNTQNKQKNTPLMMVILRGRNMVPMLEPLLARSDIDLEIRNNYGTDGATALMTAERHLKYEEDESQKYHYVDAIKLLKAKQAEGGEKSKTTGGIMSVTQTNVSNLTEPLQYIEIAGVHLESCNHGAPQCPDIIIATNEDKAEMFKPQAWEDQDVPGVWKYNFAGACAEAKFLGKKTPNLKDLEKISGGLHGNMDAIAETLGLNFTGIRVPYISSPDFTHDLKNVNLFHHKGEQDAMWGSTEHQHLGAAYCLLLDRSESKIIPDTCDKRCGLTLRFLAKETVADSPECSMEVATFRIDSTTWNTIELTNASDEKIVAKVNPEGDVWELSNKEQFFTPTSMIRETTKAGRENDVMNLKQAEWLVENSPNNIPDECTFAGFIDSKGKVHYSGAQSCYGMTDTNKVLFCVNVEEDMKAFLPEMIIGELDQKSAAQVRLLKPKTK